MNKFENILNKNTSNKNYSSICLDLFQAMNIGDIDNVVSAIENFGQHWFDEEDLLYNFYSELYNIVLGRTKVKEHIPYLSEFDVYLIDYVNSHLSLFLQEGDKICYIDSSWADFRYWLSGCVGYCVNKPLEQDFVFFSKHEIISTVDNNTYEFYKIMFGSSICDLFGSRNWDLLYSAPPSCSHQSFKTNISKIIPYEYGLMVEPQFLKIK